jgi:hypothetical protein
MFRRLLPRRDVHVVPRVQLDAILSIPQAHLLTLVAAAAFGYVLILGYVANKGERGRCALAGRGSGLGWCVYPDR